MELAAQELAEPMPHALRTLAIDVGGTGIKAVILSETGKPLTQRSRVRTPRPATPATVIKTIVESAKQQGEFDRVSVGFPGVVRCGVTVTATNLDGRWGGYHLADVLTKKLGSPVRVDLGAHGRAETRIAHPFARKTHQLVPQAADFALVRRTFDCGFDPAS